MPVPGIKHKVQSREMGWELHIVELTVGSTGAVSSVDGKGWSTSGAASAELGTVVRNGVGDYSFTLPGYGGVQKIVPMEPVIVDGAVGDTKSFVFSVRTPSSRLLRLLCVDGATDAAEELTSGTVLLLAMWIKQGSVE